jgi:hypothetical protein
VKKWFLKHALKSLITKKNSEGPAILVGGIMTALANFMPPEMLTENLEASLGTIATTMFAYAAARFYSKAAKGDGPET